MVNKQSIFRAHPNYQKIRVVNGREIGAIIMPPSQRHALVRSSGRRKCLFAHVDESNPREHYHATKGYQLISATRIDGDVATQKSPTGYKSRAQKDAKIREINDIHKTGYYP